MTAKNPSRDYSFPPLSGIESFLQNAVDQLFNQVFLMTRRGGSIRFTIFILGGLVIWIFFDLASHPLYFWGRFIGSIGQLLTFYLFPNPINTLITAFFKIFIFGGLVLQELFFNLFQGDVLRHVLAVTIPVFMAARIATAYLADIFEFSDESIASRFVTGSAFSTTYHRLKIENSDVAEQDLKSPILRVGGPGWIQVNLENVAIFERSDGQPHLIGPTGSKPGSVETIQSFERLREVIDLRDQFNWSKGVVIKGRTRDGIPVTVQNVRMIFSVLRDPQAPKGELSFDKDAIIRLAFGRGRNAHRVSEGGVDKVSFRGEWADAVKGMVSRELRDFISTHSLNEFLAYADIKDLSDSSASLNFIPRSEIKQRFLSLEFKQRAAGMGFQLNWIDIGSWDIPKLIVKEHHEAWKLVSENQALRFNIGAAAEESRKKELSRLVREIQIVAFQAQNQEKGDEEIRIDLISSYLALLRSVHDNFSADEHPDTPEVEAAINYLSSFLKEALQKSGKAVYINPQIDETGMD